MWEGVCEEVYVLEGCVCVGCTFDMIYLVQNTHTNHTEHY